MAMNFVLKFNFDTHQQCQKGSLWFVVNELRLVPLAVHNYVLSVKGIAATSRL